MGSFLIDDMMMKKGLALSGCELLLFALVWSYSKKGLALYESEISLSNHLPYTRRQIGRALQNLRSKDLIKRSENKHPGCQAYEYTVNFEKVRHIVPSWCDNMLHHDGTICRTDMGQNVASQENIMSHNNIKDSTSDNEMDNHLRSPFIYHILNKRWNALLNLDKWANKSPGQLEVAIDTIKGEEVPIAMEMLKNTISHNYSDIYPPKPNIINDAKLQEGKYLEEECHLRRPQIEEMLQILQHNAPDELKAFIPDVENCVIQQFGTLTLECHISVCKWIEGNLKIIKPFFQSSFTGFKLKYKAYGRS